MSIIWKKKQIVLSFYYLIIVIKNTMQLLKSIFTLLISLYGIYFTVNYFSYVFLIICILLKIFNQKSQNFNGNLTVFGVVKYKHK